MLRPYLSIDLEFDYEDIQAEKKIPTLIDLGLPFSWLVFRHDLYIKESTFLRENILLQTFILSNWRNCKSVLV
jgi:hypothetical protein